MNQQQFRLSGEISDAIREYYLAARACQHQDKDYQAKFSDGGRKAQPVLEYVRERFSDLSQLVYVSIGGADGSEVAAVLGGTAIRYGILLEFSDEGAAKAREHAAHLAQNNKTLFVLQGDATQRLEDCCARLDGLRNNGITGVVCSAQAVLHELRFRSPTFTFSHFFGRLFRGFDIRFFYSREPAVIQDWPETVRLRFNGPPPLPSKVVAAMGRLIADHFHLAGSVHEVIDNYVELPRAIAGEVVRKVLYFSDQSHFVYEMGECHERFDPNDVAKQIGACVGNRPLDVQRLNSNTFSLRYDQLRVEATTSSGGALPQPAAFAVLRGFIAPSFGHVSNIEAPRLLQPILHSERTFIQTTFDGDISEEEYERWLAQFPPPDQRFAEKLASAFRYYSLRRMNAALRKLFNLILDSTKVAKEKLRFIPVGYVAKSGSAIAYFFRKQNKLQEDSFLTSNDVAIFEREPELVPVLIDDFVGSGHQGRHVVDELCNAAPHFSGRLVFASVIGLESGIGLLRQNARVVPVVADLITNAELAFADPSQLFPDPEDRAAALEFAERYGRRLFPKHSLGYARSQGLVGFFYSTPNNTLPVFWSSEDGWLPLLPHGESFRDPSYLFGPPRGLTKATAVPGSERALAERIELDKYDIPEDMAVRIFGEFHKVPIFLVLAPILRNLGMSDVGFSSLLKAVAKLKQLQYEEHPVCSALLISRNADELESHGIPIAAAAPGLTLDATDELARFVQLANGLEGTVVSRPNGEVTGTVLFRSWGHDSDVFLPRRYHAAAQASAASRGLCLVFFGNGRIHIFDHGQRILSYRNAAWHLQVNDFRPGLTALGAERGISAGALETVMRLALLMADTERGGLIMVGDHKNVLTFSEQPMSSHIRVTPFTLNSEPDDKSIGLMSGDGATIVSADGVLIQAKSVLRPPDGTGGDSPAELGLRHRSAIRISHATACISIAVSVDGAVAVYANGVLRLKVMG